MPQPASQEKKINAQPTKDFFISMLVRDIELVDAIADLVDNCVDGARRLKQNGNYAGLSVRIEATAEHFRIADNCGGIPVDLARNYAFRFGRPKGMPETPHSVGQFGIGMKRALFKLGSQFVVQSATADARFTIDVDVNIWKMDENKWEFEFKQLSEGLSVPSDKRGTTIEVRSLNKGVANEFALENFQNRLTSTLAAKHELSLQKGLSMTLNKTPLKFAASELLRSGDLKPAYRELSYKPNGKSTVTVKLYVGVSESDPDAGGWYVYCNGRLVLDADKTSTTGWGEGQDVTIPKYHNQYARFRGYAFFDCDDASLLPWNTSKTDMALDSPLYQAVRQQMILLMRSVIDFLNRLKQEEKLAQEVGETPLADAVEEASSVTLSKIRTQPTFIAPRHVAVRTPKTSGTISYSKPLEDIRKIQRALKVTSYREVGEKTFDYFLKAEFKNQ
jgi:hypothetical protein